MRKYIWRIWNIRRERQRRGDLRSERRRVSISSEKLREGLSGILSRLHRGDTLDEVIQGISGGFFESTEDFEKRFIKGNYNF